jgi:uncharacterized membrane protein
MSSRLRSNWDLLLLAGLAIICAATVVLVSFSPALIVAAVFLELIAPGYAISAAVFARRETSALEFLLCCLGTSLVVAALGGVLLDQMPGEMGQGAWLVLLMAITLFGATAAIARTPLAELPLAQGRSSGLPKTRPDELEERIGLPVWLNLTLGVFAALLVIGAVVIARDASRDTPGFSELSAVPVASSGRMELMIAVRSHEKKVASYDLEIRENGRRTARHSLRLRPGQGRRLSSPLGAGAKRVTVTLYRAGERVPYLQTSYYPGDEAAGGGASQ